MENNNHWLEWGLQSWVNKPVVWLNEVKSYVKYQDGRLIRDFLVPLQRTLGSGAAPRVDYIRELIRARDGSGVVDNFQLEEIILVLDYVSTYWCLSVVY